MGFYRFLLKVLLAASFVSSSASFVPSSVFAQPVGSLKPVKSIEIDEPFNIHSTEAHEMRVLNSGLAAFEQRLQMIERAKESIEVEYFIYSTDEAGKIFTQALVKKAKQGVKVRILVDAASIIFELDEFYAKEMQKYGVEVRYYNTAFTLSPKAILYRNHRKLLIIDGIEAVTGGRNIADEYFDMDHEYNFLDRDVYIKGPLVESMKITFNEFWNHKIVSRPNFRYTNEPDHRDFENYSQYEDALAAHHKKIKSIASFVRPASKPSSLEQRVRQAGKQKLNDEPLRICPNATYASDRPGAKKRVLFQRIREVLNDIETSIVIDTPYFILRQDGGEIMQTLLAKKIDVTILTNSLYSTDAFYTVPVFKDRIRPHIENGAKVFVYRGKSEPDQIFVDHAIKKTRWGVHSKTAVFDNKQVMIGTFNVDPRSARLNTEMAVFCEGSPEIVQDVMDSISGRLNGSVQLDADAKPVDGSPRYLGAKLPKILRYYVLSPLSHIFDGLL